MFLKNSNLEAKVIKDRREGVITALRLTGEKRTKKAPIEKVTHAIGEILLSDEAAGDLALRSLRQCLAKLEPKPEAEPKNPESPRLFLEPGLAARVEFAKAFDHSQDRLFEQDPVRFLGKKVHKHDLVNLVAKTVMTGTPLGEDDPRSALVDQLKGPPGHFIRRNVE